ncbi:type III secretion system chaperone [Acanthopleuribacter pedis]|uniref:Type III secretion system chaperone n=1 Tax=Acanthopleuribacter pedis TaxID=442870 RepID=A0A8J7QNX6_9BACT|nr:type III secretion system chaperone [Acanthopleuribacter pedis]MBO1321445.1 type III secretion system chaperone [Acanthopleuribacter pedis]
MTEREVIDQALAALGDANDIKDFALGEDGSVGLSMGEGLDLALEWDEKGRHLLIYLSVVPLPETAPELLQLYHRLLVLNCLGIGTHNAVLSVQPEMKLVLMHMNVFIEDVNAARIMRTVDHLLEARNAVLTALAEDESAEAEAEEGQSAPPMDPMNMRV